MACSRCMRVNSRPSRAAALLSRAAASCSSESMICRCCCPGSSRPLSRSADGRHRRAAVEHAVRPRSCSPRGTLALAGVERLGPLAQAGNGRLPACRAHPRTPCAPPAPWRTGQPARRGHCPAQRRPQLVGLARRLDLQRHRLPVVAQLQPVGRGEFGVHAISVGAGVLHVAALQRAADDRMAWPGLGPRPSPRVVCSRTSPGGRVPSSPPLMAAASGDHVRVGPLQSHGLCAVAPCRSGCRCGTAGPPEPACAPPRKAPSIWSVWTLKAGVEPGSSAAGRWRRSPPKTVGVEPRPDPCPRAAPSRQSRAPS